MWLHQQQFNSTWVWLFKVFPQSQFSTIFLVYCNVRQSDGNTFIFVAVVRGLRLV